MGERRLGQALSAPAPSQRPRWEDEPCTLRCMHPSKTLLQPLNTHIRAEHHGALHSLAQATGKVSERYPSAPCTMQVPCHQPFCAPLLNNRVENQEYTAAACDARWGLCSAPACSGSGDVSAEGLLADTPSHPHSLVPQPSCTAFGPRDSCVPFISKSDAMPAGPWWGPMALPCLMLLLCMVG